MLVSPLDPVDVGDRRMVRARVSWEDNKREQRIIYVAVPARHANHLTSESAWALLAALPAAVQFRERRVVLDGEVDPLLLEGLQVLQRYHEHWFGVTPVKIESAGAQDRPPPSPAGTALFMSGGVDSLSSLAVNRTTYPQGHAGSVTQGVHVDLLGPSTLDLVRHDRASRNAPLRAALAQHSVDLIEVVTNIRSLSDYEFHWEWMLRAHGLAFAAVAHAISRRSWRFLVASTYDMKHLTPWGSHPLTDRHLSTRACEIHHHNEQLSRLAKLRLLLDYPSLIESLDVCFYWGRLGQSAVNCGECEKCLRTQIALLVIGYKGPLNNFECKRWNARDVGRIDYLQDEYERVCWTEIADATDSLALRSAIHKLVRRRPGRSTRVTRRIVRSRLRLADKLTR